MELLCDNPLKQLMTAFPTEFAGWLLGGEVRGAIPRPTALPTSPDSVQPTRCSTQCDYGQGYVFALPLDAEDAEALLE